jgi:hypothetical protein
LSNDPVLKRDYPDCNHGLIVALDELEDEISWCMNPEYDICNNFQKQSAIYGNLDRYAYINGLQQTDEGEGDYTNLDKILGYNNTKVLKAYNKITADKDKVLVIEPLDDFNSDNRINGTSGWYVPSVKELELLISDDEMTIYNYYDTGDQKVSKLINLFDSLGKVFIKDDTYIWSSTEYTDDDAFYLYHNSEGGEHRYSDDDLWVIHWFLTKDSTGAVRAVCAF